MSPRPLLCALLLACLHAPAADPAVRPVPPQGIPVPESDAKELASATKALADEITTLRSELKDRPALLALLPDVEIFHKGPDWALRHGEFFDPKQLATAKAQLATGHQRAAELRAGNPSWNLASGLVVRAYRSAIDGSIQPYGLVIPDDWKPGETTPRRLDFWMHGRGEKLSELDFIDQRMKQKGEFTPTGAFVLHLYGRYCCANKFAGETDLFEALANARSHYNIDPAKLVVRGFSMGGASCWQFATHFSSLWAAAAPGAGFAESKEFLKLGTTPDRPLPPAWEQTLWRWYDSTVYAANLSNLPTLAYSGEIDGQKQAADIMIRFLKEEGLSIPHLIGPQVGHKYHPDSKPQIEDFLAKAIPQHEAIPEKVRFVTHTLIYPKMAWVELDALAKQWERAEINATLVSGGITATTSNIDALRFSPGSARNLFAGAPKITVTLDGQRLEADPAHQPLAFHRANGRWQKGALPAKGLHKAPGLCGPIDHAFMSSFLMLRPTGTPLHPKAGAWANTELTHACEFWRKTFRGDAPLKDDTALTDADIAANNLILWGDPSSNAVLKKILPMLPIQWDAKQLRVAGANYDPSHHAPVLIFPNPLNPAKYVVINSGVTFREEALLNNANQIPKLPDWAVLDLDTQPDARAPGKVLQAGFFNESWAF